jgi:hypothetical protein
LLLINLSFDKDRHEELILLPVKLKLGRIKLNMNVVFLRGFPNPLKPGVRGQDCRVLVALLEKTKLRPSFKSVGL